MDSSLPELDVEKLRRFCAAQWPEQYRDAVRLEVTVRGRRVPASWCHGQWPVRGLVSQTENDEVPPSGGEVISGTNAVGPESGS